MSQSSDDFGIDPIDLSDGIGVACIPIPGLQSNERELKIADLSVRMIDVMSWRLMDNTRATDLYMGHYQVLPRYFLIRSLYEEDEHKSQAEVDRALTDTEDLVLALRLLSENDLIAPDHVVPYKRVQSQNMRPVPGVGRSRFMVTMFGETKTFRNHDQFTGREWDEELLSLGGNPFTLVNEDVPLVEHRLDLVRGYRQASPAPLLASAIRNFSVGRSRLTDQRQRLVALFCALETVMGGFRKPRTRPRLGDLVATLMFPPIDENRKWAGEFERYLRPLRNALAHGDDRYAPDYLEEAWKLLSRVLRGGLTYALKLAVLDATGWQRLATLPGNPSLEPSHRNVLPFLRNLVRQAYREHPDARKLMAELRDKE